MLTTETHVKSDPHLMPGPRTFKLRRFTHIGEVPMDSAKSLLQDHARMMHGRMVGAGGPDFDVTEHIDAFWSGFDAYLPPLGSYYLAFDEAGHIVGTGALKRVADRVGEMKHLYVKPEARRSGLGQLLVEARIRDAREMGLRELVADTFAANHEQPALYDKMGFERVDRHSMSATADITPELVPFILFFRMTL